MESLLLFFLAAMVLAIIALLAIIFIYLWREYDRLDPFDRDHFQD